jgi:hypothetical protein
MADISAAREESRPSRQSVTGLIGELMLLLLASDPARAIWCWRASPTDRFDFVAQDARIECKAASTGQQGSMFIHGACTTFGEHAAAGLIKERSPPGRQ